MLFGPFIWAGSSLYKLTTKVSKKKAAINYKHIVDGFTNYVFPDPVIENMALKRAALCSECPHAKKDGTIKLLTINDTSLKEVHGMYCELCGCPLATSLRSINKSCPDTPPKW